MNILVTGGTDFISSNWCESLIKSNSTICFDNLSTGNIVALNI